MTRRILFAVLAPAAVALLAAKPKGPKGHKGKGHDDHGGHSFRPEDRDLIVGYYGRGSGLPPGLAKRGGDLPPGLEKHLRRNGTLPPGLQKKLEPLPYALEHRLPPCEPGYERFQIGVHIVLMKGRTGIIADVLALR